MKQTLQAIITFDPSDKTLDAKKLAAKFPLISENIHRNLNDELFGGDMVVTNVRVGFYRDDDEDERERRRPITLPEATAELKAEREAREKEQSCPEGF